MLHFIVCDDNAVIRENINKVITKLMLPTDVEYRTLFFAQYDKQFAQVVNKKIGRKIYILDVEVGAHSGLDIARKIREKDWESIIIILTAHYELAYDAFKKRLLLMDFISKFDDYQQNLYDTLQLSLKVTDNKKNISFKIGSTIYKINYDDILCIIKDEASRNTIIRTYASDYSTSLSLNDLSGMLGSNFVRTHRACVINKDNVENIDFKKNTIIFKNGSTINLLSKNYKKEVKKYVFN